MNLMEKYLIKSRIETKKVEGVTKFKECCQGISGIMKTGDILELQKNPAFDNKLENMEIAISELINRKKDCTKIINEYELFIKQEIE